MKIGKAAVKLSKEVLELLVDQAYDKAPNSDFVASCEEFLNEKGFLTDKQIEALKNVKVDNRERTPRVADDAEALFDSYEDEDEDSEY